MTENKRFKILLNNKFVKSGYELTSSANSSKEYNHKSSAKRFIKRISELKAWACNWKTTLCPYYEGCILYRENNNCLGVCGLQTIQDNLKKLVIGEYRLELLNTESLRG